MTENQIFFKSNFSNLQTKHRTLQREHPAVQNMKFLHFFLIFVFLDPDPENHFNQDWFTTTVNGLGHEIDSNIA